MENKTKEQLADEAYKPHIAKYKLTFDENIQRVGAFKVGFIKGYDARQSEIDALNLTIKELSNQLTDIIKVHQNKQNHE